VTFSWEELHACAFRELKMRRRVYPKWVEAEKMSEKFADDEINKMVAIVDHLAELAEKERLL